MPFLSQALYNFRVHYPYFVSQSIMRSSAAVSIVKHIHFVSQSLSTFPMIKSTDFREKVKILHFCRYNCFSLDQTSWSCFVSLDDEAAQLICHEHWTVMQLSCPVWDLHVHWQWRQGYSADGEVTVATFLPMGKCLSSGCKDSQRCQLSVQWEHTSLVRSSHAPLAVLLGIFCEWCLL